MAETGYTSTNIPNLPLKPVRWMGSTRRQLASARWEARHAVGFELQAVQSGSDPSDFKPMPSIGSGVFEIRVHGGGEFRLIYVAKFAEAVYVLHVFEKKTRKTAKHDLELARRRLAEVLASRRGQERV